MAPVPALGDPQNVLILPGKGPDDVPGGVPAAVIHKQHPALRTDLLRRCQAPDLFQKQRRGEGQYGLFIIAGNDDIQNRWIHGNTSSGVVW